MGPKIRNAKDLFAGMLLSPLAWPLSLSAATTPFGSASRMGPGYFPVLVGAVLIFIGLVVAARAPATQAERIGRIAIKPVFLVIGAIALFAACIETLGLALAILLVVIVGYLANPQPKWVELLILAVVLTVASWASSCMG